MNYETNRLNTFSNWPTSAPVDPIRIAKAGFYYTGEGTEVQCFSCGGKISQWNYGDQVIWRHRQMEPNCEFVVNPRQSGNVPLVLGSECPADVVSSESWPASDDGQEDPVELSQDYGLTEEDEVYKSDALRLLSFTNWNEMGNKLHVGQILKHIETKYCLHQQLAVLVDIRENSVTLHFTPIAFTAIGGNSFFGSSLYSFVGTESPYFSFARVLFALQQSQYVQMRLVLSLKMMDSSVSREALVSAGFYHAGDGRLRCAWCGGGLAPFRRFGSLGTPLEVHRMYFPRCEHAASLEAAQRSNELSPPASPFLLTPPIQSPQDVTDHQTQSAGAEHNTRLLESGGTWRALGVVGGVARHPAKASLAARLATFEGWPADRTQVPLTLAEAGFFYTGTDDQVRCFYCDGGLGKWESGDAPWSEHAHWFPHCGYVLLIKGQEFVDTCRNRTSVQRTFSADSGLSSRRRNPGVNFPITDSQVEECMESGAATAALGAGLDAARVRRAIARRLRATGLPFNSSEALIDAVLDEQLNEEAWSVSPHSQRFARDILAETLRDFAPMSSIIPTQWDDRPESRVSSSSPSQSPIPVDTRPPVSQQEPDSTEIEATTTVTSTTEQPEVKNEEGSRVVEKAPLSLEEENRQLKEARMCKVCMDSEVSVVFLPCGHLVSCARCGAALAACPLCRASVRALVRAYLA